jgi:hypothetical protein
VSVKKIAHKAKRRGGVAMGRALEVAVGRVIDTTLSACAHDAITVRWWEILGPVTDEELMESAEERIRSSLAQDYHSGQLYFEDDESRARGWWGAPGVKGSNENP